MGQKRTLRAERLSKIAIRAGLWTAVNVALSIFLLGVLFVGPVASEEDQGRDYWYEKSLELYNNGSLEDSLQAVDKAIDLDPKNATLWAHKASCLNMAGVISQNQSRFDESLKAYDKAVEIDPGNTTYLLWKGYAFRQAAYGSGLQLEDRTRALEEGLRVFDLALKIDPKYGEAWTGKGVIYDDLATFNDDSARYNDSLAAYDRAIELTPKSDARDLAQAYEGKAVALSHMGQDLAAIGQKTESRAMLDKAVENYDRVIELDPEYVGREAEQNRAGILEELERHDEARAGYEKAIEQLNKSILENLNDSGAWVNKAILFREQDKYEAAVASLRNATDMAPGYVMAWEMMGEVLSDGLGRYEESIEAYDRALQLDPSDVRAWTEKGKALRSLGRGREAVLSYDRALEIDPDHASAWLGKGAALRDLGRYNESVQAYDEALRAIEHDPMYRSTSQALAVADAWLGKAESLVGPDRAEEAASAYDESFQAYEKAIQIDPEQARAWMGEGDALLCLKRYNESMHSYENATEILSRELVKNPNDADAWWLKAESLDNLGRSEAALEAYDRVIDLNSSKAFAASIRRSDIFISLGKYNESAEAFDGALNRLPTDDKKSVMGMWWDNGTSVYYNAWIADGQILRVTSAWYNRSSDKFENIMRVDSDFVAAWQRPTRGKAVSSDGNPIGRHDEALAALSTNWAHYALLNDEKMAQENIAGNWIRKGRELGFQEQDDSVDRWLMRGHELYDNGSYEEATQAYERAVSLDPNNASAWLDLGESLILRRNDEALAALDKSLDLDSQNADAWNSKGSILSLMNRHNESLQAHAKALEITNKTLEAHPRDVMAWQNRAAALSGL
jgi:tetratricopeptide (TPR) repeat protein